MGRTMVVYYSGSEHTKRQDEAVCQGTASVDSVDDPGPNVHNQIGSFVSPMAASFQVDPDKAPPQSDIETADTYGRRVTEITRQLTAGRS